MNDCSVDMTAWDTHTHALWPDQEPDLHVLYKHSLNINLQETSRMYVDTNPDAEKWDFYL